MENKQYSRKEAIFILRVLGGICFSYTDNAADGSDIKSNTNELNVFKFERQQTGKRCT